jgi:hypothetical protein
MRQVFANREQRNPQPEYETRQTGDNQQSTEQDRQEAGNRLLDDENLKNRDDEDDRREITQARQSVLRQCDQGIFQTMRYLFE